MSQNLKSSMFKLALSKKTWRTKLIYHLKALLFYPFIVIDERKAASGSSKSPTAGLEGDDVYPLF